MTTSSMNGLMVPNEKFSEIIDRLMILGDDDLLEERWTGIRDLDSSNLALIDSYISLLTTMLQVRDEEAPVADPFIYIFLAHCLNLRSISSASEDQQPAIQCALKAIKGFQTRLNKYNSELNDHNHALSRWYLGLLYCNNHNPGAGLTYLSRADVLLNELQETYGQWGPIKKYNEIQGLRKDVRTWIELVRPIRAHFIWPDGSELPFISKASVFPAGKTNFPMGGKAPGAQFNYIIPGFPVYGQVTAGLSGEPWLDYLGWDADAVDETLLINLEGHAYRVCFVNDVPITFVEGRHYGWFKVRGASMNNAARKPINHNEYVLFCENHDPEACAGKIVIASLPELDAQPPQLVLKRLVKVPLREDGYQSKFILRSESLLNNDPITGMSFRKDIEIVKDDQIKGDVVVIARLIEKG